eukprot:621894-Amphidinium_carterae.2
MKTAGHKPASAALCSSMSRRRWQQCFIDNTQLHSMKPVPVVKSVASHNSKELTTYGNRMEQQGSIRDARNPSCRDPLVA